MENTPTYTRNLKGSILVLAMSACDLAFIAYMLKSSYDASAFKSLDTYSANTASGFLKLAAHVWILLDPPLSAHRGKRTDLFLILSAIITANLMSLRIGYDGESWLMFFGLLYPTLTGLGEWIFYLAEEGCLKEWKPWHISYAPKEEPKA